MLTRYLNSVPVFDPYDSDQDGFLMHKLRHHNGSQYPHILHLRYCGPDLTTSSTDVFRDRKNDTYSFKPVVRNGFTLKVGHCYLVEVALERERPKIVGYTGRKK